MASIEKRVISAILSTIRARWDSVAQNSRVQAGSPAVVAPAKLREASFADFRGVVELKRRWGLLEDSVENWNHLWKQNPALPRMSVEPPIGWVLEAEGRIVGYLGNISLLCRYGDRTLTAVAGHGMAVDPPYRSLSLALVAAFFRQRSVDLYLSTTAKEPVARMARAFQSNVMPQPDYDSVLFWVLRPHPFSKSVMTMLGINSMLASTGSVLATLALSTDTSLRRRRPRRTSAGFAVSEVSIDEIGRSFQDLWREKLKEEPRLYADRSLETMRWHFEIPGDRSNTRVLSCSNHGELRGYAVIRDEAPDETTGLLRSIIADMMVKKDDPAVVEALMVAAYTHAKKTGSHILELWGFPESIRRTCAQWHPYTRRLRACPYHYKASDPTLHQVLSEGAAWYACPFDGDSTLSTRLPSISMAEADGESDVASIVQEGTATLVP